MGDEGMCKGRGSGNGVGEQGGINGAGREGRLEGGSKPDRYGEPFFWLLAVIRQRGGEGEEEGSTLMTSAKLTNFNDRQHY